MRAAWSGPGVTWQHDCCCTTLLEDLPSEIWKGDRHYVSSHPSEISTFSNSLLTFSDLPPAQDQNEL